MASTTWQAIGNPGFRLHLSAIMDGSSTTVGLHQPHVSCQPRCTWPLGHSHWQLGCLASLPSWGAGLAIVSIPV